MTDAKVVLGGLWGAIREPPQQLAQKFVFCNSYLDKLTTRAAQAMGDLSGVISATLKLY
jgi:hypothetical protein